MRYLAINGHRSKVPFSTWNFLEHHQNSFLGPSWDLYGAIKISGFQSSPKKSLNRHYIGRASKFRVSKQSLLLAQITVQCAYYLLSLHLQGFIQHCCQALNIVMQRIRLFLGFMNHSSQNMHGSKGNNIMSCSLQYSLSCTK